MAETFARNALLLADVLRNSAAAPGPSPQSLAQALDNGTIGQPYRPPHMEALGTLASLLEKAGQYASKVGVTVPQGSPVLPGASLSLRDLTVGDLPRLLEGISYGMGPMRGGNYATGGIGTMGRVDPQIFELLNAAPAVGLAMNGAKKAGKVLKNF